MGSRAPARSPRRCRGPGAADRTARRRARRQQGRRAGSNRPGRRIRQVRNHRRATRRRMPRRASSRSCHARAAPRRPLMLVTLPTAFVPHRSAGSLRAVGVPGARARNTAIMRTVRLGRTGLQISEICLGTMTCGLQTDREESFAIMDAAQEAGVDFIDVADVYPVGGTLKTVGRTEEIVGAWLAGKRDRFVIATKAYGRMGPGPNDVGLSRRHLLDACDASLRRLNTDYIDLYYIHRWDPETPIDQTLAALDDLCRPGKI